jgi:DNA invertase Pin-like site-specific DNA recombinase
MRLADILDGTALSEAGGGEGTRHFLAYARVSTDMQERAGLSIPAQIGEMRRYAETHDIILVDEYQEAVSAFSDESRRPEFWNMVNRAKREPSITGILVHDSSRFFRNPRLSPMVKGELLDHGVRVVSVTEPEYDPGTTAGLALDKMTEFKNAAYSMDVAFHTRKGMRENISRRDAEIGFCYKNGGSPPWGFAAYRVERGSDRRGIPIMKTLWDKDKTEVAGRAVWEWARRLLVEKRLEHGESLDHLRDFLNDSGVPAPRKSYWSTSTIQALLQPSVLLQDAGFGVWNVHADHGRRRPPTEWEIVENAQPAIITLEEAEAILAVNQRLTGVAKDRSGGRMATMRSARSPYLLTGGLFICKRCGANMVGYRNRGVRLSAVPAWPWLRARTEHSQGSHRGRGHAGGGRAIPSLV